MKKLFKTLSLLAVSTLLVGCKNSGKGGSSEQPQPEPDGEAIVLPTTLEEAKVLEFKNLKPMTEAVLEEFEESMMEDYSQFANISELVMLGGERQNELSDPSQSFNTYRSSIDVKMYTDEYAEMEGSYFINYGDKHSQLDGDGMEMEKVSAQGVRDNGNFYVNTVMDEGSGLGVSLSSYQWQVYPVEEKIPTQYILFSLVMEEVSFHGGPIGYQEDANNIYVVFYNTDYDTSSLNGISYTWSEYYQTVMAFDKQYNIQGIYTIYEEWYDHNLFSGKYEMNLRERNFTSVEVKRSTLPACDTAKRSAFLADMPYYYVARNEMSGFRSELYYQLGTVSLDADGKLTAAPSFSGTSSTTSMDFVDKDTVMMPLRSYLSGNQYFAIKLTQIKLNYLSLRGPTAGTQEVKTFSLVDDADLKAALAEHCGGKVLTYSNVDYVVLPTESFKGFSVTASAVNPVSTVFGITDYPQSNYLW